MITTRTDVWLTGRYLSGGDPNALANVRHAFTEESPSGRALRVRQ
jgi:hypothetical protein